MNPHDARILRLLEGALSTAQDDHNRMSAAIQGVPIKERSELYGASGRTWSQILNGYHEAVGDIERTIAWFKKVRSLEEVGVG